MRVCVLSLSDNKTATANARCWHCNVLQKHNTCNTTRNMPPPNHANPVCKQAVSCRGQRQQLDSMLLLLLLMCLQEPFAGASTADCLHATYLDELTRTWQTRDNISRCCERACMPVCLCKHACTHKHKSLPKQHRRRAPIQQSIQQHYQCHSCPRLTSNMCCTNAPGTHTCDAIRSLATSPHHALQSVKQGCACATA